MGIPRRVNTTSNHDDVAAVATRNGTKVPRAALDLLYIGMDRFEFGCARCCFFGPALRSFLLLLCETTRSEAQTHGRGRTADEIPSGRRPQEAGGGGGGTNVPMRNEQCSIDIGIFQCGSRGIGFDVGGCGAGRGPSFEEGDGIADLADGDRVM